MRKLHHINLVVADLDAAVSAFESLLGAQPGALESLPERGVVLRRFDLDGTWLVLVTPTRDDSPAAAWLRERGPGLFLLSLHADALDTALAELAAAGITAAGPVRSGLDNWRVIDLDTLQSIGIPVQLTETAR